MDTLDSIKSWLKTGSINLFGLPMSGKDTVGQRLAKDLNAKFLSSGDIIREIERQENLQLTSSGALWPTDMFIARILPYFYATELKDYPLVLSSIGRWAGEEAHVLTATKDSGHETRAVLYLELTEDEVRKRWQKAKELGDRGERPDDMDPEVFETRIKEFHEKTQPVLDRYRELGLLKTIPATGTREEVYARVLAVLHSEC
ncbi:nucleoside monophosphate kinase [Candidatus Saccharibacteria bacterium]|nr:nucleoside monophosphate kinase [Candidatus Saccharibacteria bacterium]